MFSGIKKGPRRALGSASPRIADGLPAHGDAPPKYDNKISHGTFVRSLYFAPNLTLHSFDVKRFPDAGCAKFFAIARTGMDRTTPSSVTPETNLHLHNRK
jgi:hypothetical protein